MRRNVLIADTDPVLRNAVTVGLEPYGVDIFTADRDGQAYKLFLEKGPSLVILDVLLPRRGGLDLLRKIKATEEGKDLPVIVTCPMTNCSDLRREAMEELGASAFFEKPLDFDSIRSRVEKLFTISVPCETTFEIAFMPYEVPERGELSANPFPALLHHLLHQEFTGRLNLVRERVKKILFLERGKVVFATSNRVSETLGRSMMAAGVITEEVYGEALEKLGEGSKRFGEILVDMGVADEELINKSIRNNICQKVSEVFSWSSGRYAITRDGGHEMNVIDRSLEGREIFWNGVMKHMSIGEILAAMRPKMDSYIAVKRNPEKLCEDMELNGGTFPFLRRAQEFPGNKLEDALVLAKGEREVRTLFALLIMEYFAFSSNQECRVLGDGEDVELLQRFYAHAEYLRELKGRNLFRVLGVPLDASDEVVHTAYLERAREYHPDTAVAEDSDQIKQVLSEIFVIIKKAYDSIKDCDDRKKYLKRLQEPLENERMEGAIIIEAETKFQQGMVAMKRRNLAEALPLFQAAYGLHSDESDYALYCGIAMMYLNEGDPVQIFEEARKMFMIAADLDRAAPEPYYRLGLLYKRERKMDKAKAYFQRAMVRDPGHIESKREVRLMNVRQQGLPRKSMFGSLMGKKR